MATVTADAYAVAAGVRAIRMGRGSPVSAALALSLSATVVAGSAAAGTVTNTGTAPAAWSLSASPSATISPSSGTLAAGASVPVAVTPAAADTYSVALASAGATITGSPATLTATAPTSWVPAAGAVAQIGYTMGAHPSGLPAVLNDIRTNIQSWNPTPSDVGPWGAGTPGARKYTFLSMGAYCGATFAQSVRQWISLDAGHSAINIPVPRAFDLNTLAWSWLGVPPPTDGLDLSSSGNAIDIAAVYPAAQFDTTWGEWQGGYSGWPSGFARPGKVFPEPSHTGNCIVWVPGSAHGNTNGIVMPLSTASGRQAGGDITHAHYWDLDTGLWVRTANRRNGMGSYSGGAVWFGGSVNRVFAFSHQASTFKSAIDVYTPSTRSWATTNATAPIECLIDDGGLLAHAASGVLIHPVQALTDGSPSSSGGTRMKFYAVSAAAAAAGAHTWSVLSVTATSWPLTINGTTNYISWCYCPRNACFYAINGVHNSTTLWKLAPPAGAVTLSDYLTGVWTITTETLSVPISNRSITGATTGASFIYNKLVWDDVSGCLIWTEEFNLAKVQAIRPAGV